MFLGQPRSMTTQELTRPVVEPTTRRVRVDVVVTVGVLAALVLGRLLAGIA